MSGKRKKQSTNPFATIRREFETPNYGLRQFRRDLQKLQNVGLIKSKTNVKKQNPTRHMLSQIRKFADVLNGKAHVLFIPHKEKAIYKAAGHRVKNGVAVIQTPHGEKVLRNKTVNGIPSYETYGGKSAPRVHSVVPYHELERYLREVVMEAPPLKKGEQYGFKFKGYNSYRLFSNRESLLEYFLAYQQVEEAVAENREDYSQEIYEGFVVVKVGDAKAWNQEIRDAHSAQKKERRERNRERYNAWRRRTYGEMDELEKRERREQTKQTKSNNAARERARRAQLKHDDPAAYAAMLAKNAERTKKSRAKSKAAKK